jgi:hypothetical protein
MAVAVGMVLLAAVTTAIVSGQRSSTGIERKVTTNQDARAALELMAAEIRMASFNSTLEPNLWRNPGDCTISGNQNWRGIQEATATSITVEMDIESPNPSRTCGDIDGEIIRYAYDAANNRITRENVRCPGGRNAANEMSFLGPIAGQPEVRTVEVVNNALPVFRYFDGTGPRSPTPTCPSRHPEDPRIEDRSGSSVADVDLTSGRAGR